MLASNVSNVPLSNAMNKILSVLVTLQLRSQARLSAATDKYIAELHAIQLDQQKLYNQICSDSRIIVDSANELGIPLKGNNDQNCEIYYHASQVCSPGYAPPLPLPPEPPLPPVVPEAPCLPEPVKAPPVAIPRLLPVTTKPVRHRKQRETKHGKLIEALRHRRLSSSPLSTPSPSRSSSVNTVFSSIEFSPGRTRSPSPDTLLMPPPPIPGSMVKAETSPRQFITPIATEDANGEPPGCISDAHVIHACINDDAL